MSAARQLPDSVESKIRSRVQNAGRGSVFVPGGFAALGNRQSVDFALHRLVKQGVLRRLARGIYDYPKSPAARRAFPVHGSDRRRAGGERQIAPPALGRVCGESAPPFGAGAGAGGVPDGRPVPADQNWREGDRPETNDTESDGGSGTNERAGHSGPQASGPPACDDGANRPIAYAPERTGPPTTERRCRPGPGLDATVPVVRGRREGTRASRIAQQSWGRTGSIYSGGRPAFIWLAARDRRQANRRDRRLTVLGNRLPRYPNRVPAAWQGVQRAKRTIPVRRLGVVFPKPRPKSPSRRAWPSWCKRSGSTGLDCPSARRAIRRPTPPLPSRTKLAPAMWPRSGAGERIRGVGPSRWLAGAFSLFQSRVESTTGTIECIELSANPRWHRLDGSVRLSRTRFRGHAEQHSP